MLNTDKADPKCPVLCYDNRKVKYDIDKTFSTRRKDDLSMTKVKGNIYEKKGSPYYWIVLDYLDANGKRIKKWENTHVLIKGNNKRLAQAKLKEVLAERNSNQIDLSKDFLFVDFMAQWLEIRRDTKAIAPTTYDGYKLVFDSHIKPYFEPLRLKVKDITPSHLEKYINVKIKGSSSKRGLSPNSVIKHLHNISKCLDTAIRQNIIAFNPAKRIDWPQKIKYTGARHLSPQQIEQLLTVVKGDVIEPIILFAIFYGMRRSEILGMKWDAIDLDSNTFTIRHTVTRVNNVLHKSDRTKNKSSYGDMPIPLVVKRSLESVMQAQMRNKLIQPNDYLDEGYIFTHVDGRLILPNYASKRFTQLLERNNLPHIRFHDLRHPYVKQKLKKYLLRFCYSTSFPCGQSRSLFILRQNPQPSNQSQPDCRDIHKPYQSVSP